MNIKLPVHYRYRDYQVSNGHVEVVEEKFYPIRETECFYWLLNHCDYEVYKTNAPFNWDKRSIKVGKTSLKPKYSPCKKTALRSFKARKRWQCHYAKRTLERSIHLIKMLDDVDLLETKTNYGSNYAKMGKPEKVVDFNPFNANGITFEDFMEM